ncbi:MAG: hypothetical protein U5K79_25705 [Cyclobacteriaceae bacterium]|nr:hypothetical protein [Cyclobacteriaceae bacterium]
MAKPQQKYVLPILVFLFFIWFCYGAIYLTGEVRPRAEMRNGFKSPHRKAAIRHYSLNNARACT